MSRFSSNLEAFLFSCLCFQSSSTKSFLLGVAAELCSHCSSVDGNGSRPQLLQRKMNMPSNIREASSSRA